MTRLSPLNPHAAHGKARTLLDEVQASLGVTPNLMRTMAQSEAVLEAYLGFANALKGGLLDAKLREQIALAVAEVNACDYCLAAHSAVGKMVGLKPEQMTHARLAMADDPKAAAVLTFARSLVEDRGVVSDEQVARLRGAGLGDGEIGEVVANVALNLFTNYFNHVAGTEVDFPRAPALDRATHAA